MDNFDARKTPAYAILESYAHDDEKNKNLDDSNKEHIWEIARNNPKVWAVAKEDFELYKFW